MNIKLTDKYYLKSDSMNYILCEKAIGQDKKSKNYGTEVFKNIGYYPNIKFLISSLIEYDIKQQDIETLHEMMAHIVVTSQLIEDNLCKEKKYE